MKCLLCGVNDAVPGWELCAACEDAELRKEARLADRDRERKEYYARLEQERYEGKDRK